MLGHWSETLVWELEALGSVVAVACYVSLGQPFSLPGAPFPWGAVLCLPVGFLSLLTICTFHGSALAARMHSLD